MWKFLAKSEYVDFKGFKVGFKGFRKILRFRNLDFWNQRSKISLVGNFRFNILSGSGETVDAK